MSPALLDAAAVVAVAVVVLVAVTSLAMRARAHPAPGASARRVRGPLAALPTWGGVLIALVLAARGRFALAAIAALATVLYVGVVRVREAAALRRR